MIAGVQLTPLKQIADERGKVMHMLRSEWTMFQGFGEVYFSCIYSGAIKAWKLHKQMTMNIAVPHGRIKMVLFDDRPESPTRGQVDEILLGEDKYCLLTVPPNIWNGFQGISSEMALLANCASISHNPDEVLRRESGHSSIPYKW